MTSRRPCGVLVSYNIRHHRVAVHQVAQIRSINCAGVGNKIFVGGRSNTAAVSHKLELKCNSVILSAPVTGRQEHAPLMAEQKVQQSAGSQPTRSHI